MAPVSKGSGSRFLLVVVVLALAGLLVVLTIQARTNRDQVAELKTKIRAQAIEIRTLGQDQDKLSTDLSREKLQKRDAEEKASRLEAELEAAAREGGALRAELDRTRGERDAHLGALLESDGRLDATETALATEIADGRERLAEQVGLLRRARSRFEEEQARAEGLEGRLARLGQQVEALQVQLQRCVEERNDLVDLLDGAGKAREALQDDLRAALEKSVDLRAEVERLTKEKAELAAARDEMARRLKAFLEKEKAREESGTADDRTK